MLNVLSSKAPPERPPAFVGPPGGPLRPVRDSTSPGHTAETAPDSRLLIEDFDRPRPPILTRWSRALGAPGIGFGVNTAISCDMDQRVLRCMSRLIRKPKPGQDPAGLRFSLSGSLWTMAAVRNLTLMRVGRFRPAGEGSRDPLRCGLIARGRSCLLEGDIPPRVRMDPASNPVDPARCLRSARRRRQFRAGERDRFPARSGRQSFTRRLLLGALECPGPRPDSLDWKGASDEDLIDYVEYHTYQSSRALPTDDGVTLDRTSSADIFEQSPRIGFGTRGPRDCGLAGLDSQEQGANGVLRI